jgi:hypothetical protein
MKGLNEPYQRLNSWPTHALARMFDLFFVPVKEDDSEEEQSEEQRSCRYDL